MADFRPAAIPPQLAGALASIQVEDLGVVVPEVAWSDAGGGWWRIEVSACLPGRVDQDAWRVQVRPAFAPGFHWAPHLTPDEGDVIDQQVFRAPALVAADAGRVLWLIPDTALGTGAVRTWLDQDAPANRWTVGRSCTEVHGHVLFRRTAGATFTGRERIAFYLAASQDPADVANPFRRPSSFWWGRHGAPLLAAGEPLAGDLRPFVAHAYDWAFTGWERAVWQEFAIDGRRVGAPAFIVNVTESPNHPGPAEQREFLSVWNQAWFSSLRSASGLFRWARRAGDARLLERARMTKELALAFPQDARGLFPGLIGCENHEVEVAGRRVRRSRGWEHRFWGNSDRQPLPGRTARTAPYHLADMSWTCLQMLRWHAELEADPRLLAYARRYAEGLVSFQDGDGHVPSWVEPGSFAVVPELAQSPQTAVSAWFLLELGRQTGDSRWIEAGLRAARAVADGIVASGRWEDFETYWSCSRWGADSQVGRPVARNARYKQNTLAIYWTAEALAAAAGASGDPGWLVPARRCLDELLMYQAAWQPPHCHVPVLGGFGVMNADAEWNDSRQSLFAEFIAGAAERHGCAEYRQRGEAALRASFSMMFCPENPRSYAQWKRAWPFFAEADHGFMMENYGHNGRTSPQGEGIGSFTIYDWGNGAAAEAWNRMADHGLIAGVPAQPNTACMRSQ